MTRPTPTVSTGSTTTPTGSMKPTRQGLTDRQPSSARHRPEPVAPPAEREPDPEPEPERPAGPTGTLRRRPPPGRVSPQALADARGGAVEGLDWLGRGPEARASMLYRG